MKAQKTIKIKLNPTKEQTQKLNSLIEGYIKISNFTAKKIAEIQESFTDSGLTQGICSECEKEKTYRKYHLLKKDNKLFCITCYKRKYSQFTLQKVEFQNKIGLRNVANLPKTYYTNAIRFASDTFSGFDEIKKKKQKRLSSIQNRLDFWKELLYNPSNRNEIKIKVVKYAPKSDKREHPHYYSEAEIKGRIKRLEKQLKKFKMPKYPEFTNETISLQRELYSWKNPNGLKISSITDKNENMDYYGKKYLKKYIDLINSQTPQILIEKENNSFYLCFPITKNIEMPKIDDSFEPVGIDWGITRNIAVVSILDSKTKKPKFVKFYPAGYVLSKRKHYKSLRKHFGQKKRQDKINQLGTKEDRFIDSNIHKLAFLIVKEIMNHSKKPIILMENITDNREEAEKSMRQNILLHSVKNRLQNYIAYKALWNNISTNLVKPEHTSQICNRCGHQDRENRPNGSKLFKCVKCNYMSNADFNASINIARKFYIGEYEPFYKDNEKMKSGVNSTSM